MKVVSRLEAIGLKMKRYFTGEACVHGHIAERLTSNRKCVQCSQDEKSYNYKPTLVGDGVYCPTKITSCVEAKRIGLNYFYTGQPCKNGHVDIRKVSNHTCVTCQLELYVDNKEVYKERDLENRTLNAARIAEQSKVYHQKRKISHSALLQVQRKAERCRNKSTRVHYAQIRRAQLIDAMPSWVNSDAIKRLYQVSAELTVITGAEHHVHHIVPLLACADVCGLHCESNLVVVSKEFHHLIHSDINLLRSLW